MSIAEDIRNAITELKGTEVPEEVIEQPEVEVSDVQGPEDAPEGEKTAKRGPDGKFVAKEPEQEQDTPAKTETETSIRPPASWSPAAKAKFLALDPDIQQEVLRRERETDKGFRERAEQLKRYEPLEQVIAPRRDLWAAQGLDEASAIKTLLAAQDLLEKNPVQGLTYLAKSYGVDLASVAGQSRTQPAAGTTGQPTAQPDPVTAAELQALKQELQALKQGREQEVQSTYQAQIEAFASDPANLYFENVKPKMAALLQSGAATDLSDAYQQAIWADPNIRPLLLQEQAKPRDQRERVERARAASVSVTGSPGAAPPMASNGSIRDDIRLAIQQVSGRA